MLNSYAEHDLDATGWVAGLSTTKTNGGDAFVWDGQKMTDLGQQAPLHGNESRANGINDSGEAVGQYAANGSGQDHAFSYSNGTVTGLPKPKWASDDGCLAFAINNSGQIAGSCDDTSGNQHLMLWDNGKFTDHSAGPSPADQAVGATQRRTHMPMSASLGKVESVIRICSWPAVRKEVRGLAGQWAGD